jgi:hypothetical protein
MLAIKIYQTQGGTPNSSYIPGGTARSQELEPDIDLAIAVPVAGSVDSSIKIVEKIYPDGSKTIEKTTTDAYGNATVSVITENKEAGKA